MLQAAIKKFLTKTQSNKESPGKFYDNDICERMKSDILADLGSLSTKEVIVTTSVLEKIIVWKSHQMSIEERE